MGVRIIGTKKNGHNKLGIKAQLNPKKGSEDKDPLLFFRRPESKPKFNWGLIRYALLEESPVN
jgi:hypothetical protein